MKQVKVLFVCMGNICRSPMAEGVFRHYTAQAGLDARVVADSAGTHDYHIGEPPDPRAQRAASRRGYDLSTLRGRQVSRRDFSEFDYLLAMDEVNFGELKRLCPAEHAHKLRLLMDYAAEPAAREVPDPYYGGPQGFERVLDLVEQAAQGLLRHLRRELV
ncbi:MAG: low molecular weight phosphotyrosine protein phosphatase [Betaproteobacteria bacterium]|nr:low molecular weight phosphotyrosine protein phosphatase [Betaproteobacteria bacterium]